MQQAGQGATRVVIMGAGPGGMCTAIKLKHREKIEQMRLAAAGHRDDGQLARQDAKIEALEDRLAVLERIITDNSINVAAQIEALRDTTSIEQLTRQRDRV